MKNLLVIVLVITSVFVRAQGIQDSVFHIKEVPILFRGNFNKDEAGMKETRVDSLVLLNKISLSLSDLLSENTSVFVKSSGRGALATASFRGTAASHTQVLWNGMSINSPMTGTVDFSLIPVCMVDNMTMRHGAASIADNSGGLGGAISLSNMVNWQNRLSVRYSQGVGSYSTFNEFADLGYGHLKVQGRTRLFHSYSANDYTFKNMRRPNIGENGELTFPSDTNKNADYMMYGLLQEVYWRVNTQSTFSLKYWGQYADRAIPTVISYEGDVNSNISTQTDADHRVIADYKIYTENSRLSISGGYSHKNLDYVAKHLIVGAGIFPTVFSQSTQQNYLGRIDYQQSFDNSISAQANLSVSYFDVSSVDTVSKLGYDKDRSQTSLLLSVRKNFANRLNLNLTLRQDYIDNELVPLIPYLGFDFRLFSDINLLLKGNVARNYHQPSLNDLYWIPGGNPNLCPEEGISFELGAEYQAQVYNSQISSELTYYRSDIDNWIVWLPNFKGYWEPLNIKRVLSTGLECSLKISGALQKFKYRASGTFSYSKSTNYGDSRVWGDDSYGKQLVYVPLYSGNVLVNVEYQGFYVNYQFNSYSERFTTSSNEVTSRERLYPYFMNDVYVGKKLAVWMLDTNLEFRIYNLFNERYHSELFRPMPRQHYMLQLTVKF